MWVSVRDAANLLNVSEDTVRRRIKSGDIPHRQEPTRSGFRWLVELPDFVLDSAPASTPHELRTDSEATPATIEVTLLRELVSTLERERAMLVEELEARRREVRELHVIMGREQGRTLPLHELEQAPALPPHSPPQRRRARPLWQRLLAALSGP